MVYALVVTARRAAKRREVIILEFTVTRPVLVAGSGLPDRHS